MTDVEVVLPAEKALLRRLLRPGALVLDVGAKVGEWTRAALEAQPDATVHLFEPSPAPFQELRRSFRPLLAEGRVTANNLALGEAAGALPLQVYPDHPDLTSFHRRLSVERQLRLPSPDPRQVPVLSLDGYCAGAGIRLINYLKVDVEGHELAVLRGARGLLSRRLVDFVQLEYGGTYQDAGIRLAQVFDELAAHGYLMFQLRGDELCHHPRFRPELEDYQYGIYLAAAPRLRTLMLGGQPRMFEYDQLFQRHGITPKGLVHVGAHEGEELPGYARAGCQRVVFIEGDPDTFQRLSARFAGMEQVRCLSGLVSDRSGTATFHRMSFDQSSSLLPLKKHAELYPGITEAGTVELPTTTLDELLARAGEGPGLNLLAIDVQGAELQVLRGAAALLAQVQAVLVEVNYAELYAGCGLVYQIDDLLEPLGFRRVEETTPFDPSWGDALYLRRPRVTMSTLGHNGRFANQLFQYAFLEQVAERLDGVVETPPWIGEALFDLPVRRPSGTYPQLLQDFDNPEEGPEDYLGRLTPGADVDVWGFFQYHTRLLAPRREHFQRLFTPRPELGRAMDAALGRLRGDRRTLVALHLRRGDFGYGRFWVAPAAWYAAALEELWPHLDAPWLYLASDDLPAVLPDFARFAPHTAADLGPHLAQRLGPADFFPDFYALTQADVVGISNSSFSLVATLLNRRAAICLRPDPDLQRMVPFSPWSSPVLLDPRSYPRALREVEGLLARDQIDQARERLEAFVAHSPGSPEAHNDLAVLRQMAGDLAGARAAADRAAALAPRKAGPHCTRAAILLASGALAESAQALEQAMRIDPTSPEALQLAAQLSQALGRPDEARAFLQTGAGA